MSMTKLDGAAIKRIILVTDFGSDLYVGQMRARLDALLPGVPVIDLIHDLSPFRPDLAAYLLGPMMRDLPDASLYLCVVDPGVGGARDILVVETDGVWLIGPDNGLLAPLVAAAGRVSIWRIGWTPPVLSPSFHGRDWLVPAAARLHRGEDLDLTPVERHRLRGADWPAERALILYVDRFGNLMTGLRAAGRPTDARLRVGDLEIARARTFCEVAPGEPFWYENALGLVEIAVNQGRADQRLGLGPGDAIGPFSASGARNGAAP